MLATAFNETDILFTASFTVSIYANVYKISGRREEEGGSNLLPRSEASCNSPR
jgi:hypothetical protein